ncbi:MAG: hypothetical protein DRP76_04905, partial [Candidatus Omnitrophota bacterium]
GEVKIDVKEADFVNEGEIITNGSQDLPDAGNISVEAVNILHRGIISADAYNGGDAGEIEIISANSTILDENSTTSAACPYAIGNGGRIYINSKGGSTFVKKSALIDVSAGSIQGNGGFIEISAFDHLGFYGVLNGRAPPGYEGATIIFDPDEFTGSFNVPAGSTVTVWATENIYISGNITLETDTLLNLFADHQSKNPNNWDDGTGAIINQNGAYTISAEEGATNTSLNLKAGSGIGTADHPIKTDIHSLSAEINPDSSGNVYISQGSRDLTISSIIASGVSSIVSITAGGSILDDGDDTTYIEASSINLVANGNIGGFNDEGESLEKWLAPMLDISPSGTNFTLSATASEDIFIATYIENLSTSSVFLTSTGSDKEIGLVNLAGGVTINSSLSGGDDEIWVGAFGNITLNSEFTTTSDHIGLYACGDVIIEQNANYYIGDNSYTWNDMDIWADVDQNGVGKIIQNGGSIGSGKEFLLLYSARGISVGNMNVSYLQATNTIFGEVSIVNSDTLTLGNRDGSELSEILNNNDDKYEGDLYAVANLSGGTTSIEVNNGDLLTGPVPADSGEHGIVAVYSQGGTVNLSASGNIILGKEGPDGYYDNIWVEGEGDINLTARGNIASCNGSRIEVEGANGTITLNAEGDVHLGHIITENGQITITSSGDILDDSTDSEIWYDENTHIPTLLRAQNIILDAEGKIGYLNENADSIDKVISTLIDVDLLGGTLRATAGEGIAISENKPNGLNFTTAKYNLIYGGPEYGIIFVNRGDLNFGTSLNLDQIFHFGSTQDINVNQSITNSGLTLGFHAYGDLNINSNITVTSNKYYNQNESEWELPEIDLRADLDRNEDGQINISDGVNITATYKADINIIGENIN